MNASNDGNTLSLPPLPTLKWDEYFWATDIVLTAWAGFRGRIAHFTAIDTSIATSIASDGSITLTVATTDDEPYPPSAEQVAAYQYLIEHQGDVRDSILQAILAEYPTWQESYQEVYEADEFEELMPQIQESEQLKDLIGLAYIHIHTVARDGMAYVGYGFGCTWEEEHGLGAMTNADRVVELGYADVSILEWIAKRDAAKD